MGGRPASRGNGKGKQAPGKRPGPQPAQKPEPQMVAVRMLVGPHAGQTVPVTAEQASRLCGGWTPQAELVARNAASLRETR